MYRRFLDECISGIQIVTESDVAKAFAGAFGSVLEVDVDMDDDKYVICSEVAGIKEENIDISFENNTITITADYGDEGKFKKGKYVKSFRLVDVDSEKISAKLENGLLTIMVPKLEEKKSRKINID